MSYTYICYGPKTMPLCFYNMFGIKISWLILVIRLSLQLEMIGVHLSIKVFDLSHLDKYVSSVCKTYFFWLRQLRRVSRSLDTESLKTLVHAHVTSRVDYCNSVLASSPKTITDELAAAGIECRSMSDLWHRQVRSRSVTDAPRWTALAWYSSAGAVQACRDCSPMSPESSTDVPCRSLHSHLWSYYYYYY